MALLDDVKLSLGISHSKKDTDILSVILAAKSELSIAGVENIGDDDALIVQAVKLYCRWYFNYQGQADRYLRAFDGLRQSLSLCGDYGEGGFK